MTVHDYFDGSNHCVECKGPCTLESPDQALSQIVRYAMEQIVWLGGKPNMLLAGTLVDLGVDVERFVRRVKDEY